MKLLKRSIALLVVLALFGCDNTDVNKISVHDAYRLAIESGSFPPIISEQLNEILNNSSYFGMTEYQEFDLVIRGFCTGNEITWRDRVMLLPTKFISVVIPSWNSFAVLTAPELMMIRQIDAANTCVFNPLTNYIEE